jgi:hypothetical protein
MTLLELLVERVHNHLGLENFEDEIDALSQSYLLNRYITRELCHIQMDEKTRDAVEQLVAPAMLGQSLYERLGRIPYSVDPGSREDMLQ